MQNGENQKKKCIIEHDSNAKLKSVLQQPIQPIISRTYRNVFNTTLSS